MIFPIVSDELLVDARVNVNAAALLDLRNAGLAAPPSVPVRAVVDTGSNATGVAPWIVQQLGIQPEYHTNTQGIGGTVRVGIYRVSLSILDANQPHIPWFVQPDLLVMEMPSLSPVDVLIGMDVLLECRMLVDGPARSLTIDF